MSGKTTSLCDFRLGGFQLTEDVSVDGGSLFCSARLADLYLSHLGLSKAHFCVIASCFSRNDSLRVLDLFGNTVYNENVILIVNALENNCCLETLVLPCPTDSLSVESCAAISKALQINKTLLTLNLPRSNLSDDGLLHIVHGLTVNTTVKKIEVGISKQVSDKSTAALKEMLENNYELERLVVSSAKKDIKDKIEHFMRLSGVGRGSLLRDGKATREQLVDMLISVSNDLDCLFYFITMNPSLCQFANTRGAAVIITEEIKPRRRHTMDYSPFSFDDVPKETVKARRASVFW